MFEMDLDAPDYADYEAEQERLHRLRKRQEHEFEIADERIVDNEFV